MSDIMFYFKVCFNNWIKVCVFYQQESIEKTDQKIQVMIITLLTNFAGVIIFWIETKLTLFNSVQKFVSASRKSSIVKKKR